MTNREILDDADSLLIEAADWLVCLTSGEATEEDAERLAAWRATSPSHEAAFREVAGARSYAVVASRTKKPGMVSRRAVLAGGTSAAVAAITVGVARPPLGLWPSYAELTADHRTAVGQRFAFVPTAGVEVEMNSRTALSLIDGNQGISLVTGEAFVAARNLSEPFRVESGKLRATTRSAQFNIQSLAGGVRLACVSGSLDCDAGGTELVLRANEQLVVAPDGAMRRISIDGQKATAWRQGLLIFEGAPLSEVVEQINIYRQGRIVLASTTVGGLPVNAVIHTDCIDDAVTQIEQQLQLRARHLAGGVVVMS